MHRKTMINSNCYYNYYYLPSELPPDNKNVPYGLNPTPYPQQEYLLGSAFLVSLTAPNK